MVGGLLFHLCIIFSLTRRDTCSLPPSVYLWIPPTQGINSFHLAIFAFFLLLYHSFANWVLMSLVSLVIILILKYFLWGFFLSPAQLIFNFSFFPLSIFHRVRFLCFFSPLCSNPRVPQGLFHQPGAHRRSGGPARPMCECRPDVHAKCRMSVFINAPVSAKQLLVSTDVQPQMNYYNIRGQRSPRSDVLKH